MTIDEAIEHAEERACGNDQCAKDHAQLADWLRELRRARMEIDLLKTLRDGFRADAQKYKADNAKLRERIHELEMEGSDYFYRTAYAEDANRTLESDNAKLRELLVDTLIDPRDYCAKYGIDYDGWDSANDDIDRRLRELGIEVR